MITASDMISFVKDVTHWDEVSSNTDIFSDLPCTGDDFHELIAKYAKKYSVDMSSYLWYFHANEEGQNLGGFFFRPPYKRVKRIPITPQILTNFANEGKWDIKYPEHKLAKYRIDIWISWLVLLVIIIFFALISCMK